MLHAILVLVLGLVLLAIVWSIVKRIPLPSIIPGWLIDVLFGLALLFLVYYSFAPLAGGL